MKLNNESGLANRAKAFYLKSTNREINFENVNITEDDVAWIVNFLLNTYFIYRFDSNGVILQIIWTGSKNLNFITTSFFFEPISETDFLFYAIPITN